MSHTVKLNYEETGTGAPVVLLHGYPFNHTIWRGQVAALAALLDELEIARGVGLVLTTTSRGDEHALIEYQV